ncbi:MAG: hypothetical protein A2017_09855 [Lentisphaerae bacterium GWF2_44_16]|nr:MAG: hypothetical protein A2017_09855 [Lentisphaerae bacterium GWF2_44_16]
MSRIKRKIILLAFFVLSGISGFSEETVLPVTNMESELKYTVHGMKNKPAVSISSETASQGSKSLCFEYTGTGKDRVWVTIPVKADLSPYNVLAFDFYCKNDNGAKFFALLHQKTGIPGKEVYYSGVIKLEDGRDGWTTVKLVKDRTLCLEKNQSVQGDWSKISAISFGIRAEMHGKALLFIDNIRFEKGNSSANMLYNSSFEMSSNPDVPDGWRRDLNQAPFGKDVWGIDDREAFHGKKSLRIGVKDKYVSSLARSHLTRLKKDTQYTLSVYLKSDKPDTMVRIRASEITPSKAEVSVGTDWKRYVITGKTNNPENGSVATITLLTENAALWVDAAQLEEGPQASDFAEANNEIMLADSSTQSNKNILIKEKDGNPVVSLQKAEKGTEGIKWDAVSPMSSFVKLDNKGNSDEITTAKICYDDKALYILVKAQDENTQRLKELLEKNKKGPYGTDVIELFIRPDHSKNGYYQFAANAKGEKLHCRYIAPREKAEWECDWEATGKVNDKDWTVEFRIPFTCFDPSEKIDDRIGVNICRTFPPNKYSSWSPCFSHGLVFREPSSFGVAEGLDEEVSRHYKYQTDNLDFYKGKASAVIRNNTGKDSSLKIKFTTTDSQGKKISSSTISKSLKAGENSEISANLNLPGDGIYKLNAEAVDSSNNRIFVSQPVSFRLSGVSVFNLCGTEYNFYTSDEKARIRAFIESEKEHCDKMQIEYSIKKDGKLMYGPEKFTPKSGINEWEIPIKQFSDGTYLISAVLSENGKIAAKQESSFIKCKPSKYEVRINQWGNFFVYNMQPVFPYGFYDNSPGSNNLKNWEDMMKNVKDTDCNVHMAYTWLDPDYENNLKSFLDMAEKYGQKIWVHLGPSTTYFEPKYASEKKRFVNEEDASAALKRTVEKYKEHPALFGWCTVDEPGNKPNIYTKELLEKYYNTVKNLDPCHPCAPSHVTHIGDSKVYGNALDCSFVPYGNDIRSDCLFQELQNLGKPIIVNRPCFGGMAEAKREPLPEELRAAVYKTIILGARGICYYTYRCSSDILWNEISKIGKELKQLTPVFLTPDDKLRLEITPRNSEIYGLLKAYKGKYFLFTVNAGNKDINAIFRLADIPSFSKAKPLLDSVKVEANPVEKTLSVPMKKMSTAFYEIE